MFETNCDKESLLPARESRQQSARQLPHCMRSPVHDWHNPRCAYSDNTATSQLQAEEFTVETF